jgi:hypothetical protein
MDQAYSRRNFIRKYIIGGSVLLNGALLFVSCNSKKKSVEQEQSTSSTDPCSDFSGVSENDRKAREKLGYVSESPNADMKCNNCNLWLPPAAGKACGKCMLFKGPVYATAYCTYWAPQV